MSILDRILALIGKEPSLTDAQMVASYRIICHVTRAKFIEFLSSDHSAIYDVYRNNCHGAFVISPTGNITRVGRTSITRG